MGGPNQLSTPTGMINRELLYFVGIGTEPEKLG